MGHNKVDNFFSLVDLSVSNNNNFVSTYENKKNIIEII